MRTSSPFQFITWGGTSIFYKRLQQTLWLQGEMTADRMCHGIKTVTPLKGNFEHEIFHLRIRAHHETFRALLKQFM